MHCLFAVANTPADPSSPAAVVYVCTPVCKYGLPSCAHNASLWLLKLKNTTLDARTEVCVCFVCVCVCLCVCVCVIHTHTHTHTRIDYQALHVLSGKQLLDIADLEFVHF